MNGGGRVLLTSCTARRLPTAGAKSLRIKIMRLSACGSRVCRRNLRKMLIPKNQGRMGEGVLPLLFLRVTPVKPSIMPLEHFQLRCIGDSTMTEPRARVVWGDARESLSNRLFQRLGGSGFERT